MHGFDDWCREHLGAAPVATLFDTGHLSRVVGLRLEDGREVVVKARSPSPRLAGCAVVHRHAHRAGIPSPAPLAGPAPLSDGLVASAEAYVPGGTLLTRSTPDAARRFARLLHELVTAARDVPDDVVLEPVLPWVGWSHDEDGLWPTPDEGEPLDEGAGPAWLDRLAEQVRERIARAALRAVVGHADFMSQNVHWRPDGTPLAVHDWDSAVRLPEAGLAGAAAVAWPGDGSPTAADVEETDDFLIAYEHARGQRFGDDEREVAWAAGLWLLAFDAKKHVVAGTDLWLLDKLAAERGPRAERAGLG